MSEEQPEPVLLTVDSRGVATITLNRPHVANSMDVALLRALHRALVRCATTGGVRVVILTGAGKNFCAGGDVKDFVGHGDLLPAYISEVSTWFQCVTSAMLALEAPIICAVRGYAAGGGGLGLVGSSDFVIAGESSKFMSGAVRAGLIPDGGLTVILTHLVGLRRAMDIVMRNPTLSAAEAMQIGLITQVVPDVDLLSETDLLARTLMTSSPGALAECKRLMWSGIGRSVHQALPDEGAAATALAGTSACLESLRAVASPRRSAHV